MIRSSVIIGFAALSVVLTPASVAAQTRDAPEGLRVERPPLQRHSGPRFGFTAFTGDVAAARQNAGKSRFMSQFGWQLETQLSEGGPRAPISGRRHVGSRQVRDPL